MDRNGCLNSSMARRFCFRLGSERALTILLSALLFCRCTAEFCPGMGEDGTDVKYMWRCATTYSGSGMPEFDEGCREVLKQKVFWGFEGGDECQEYWGGKGKVGLYNRFTRDIGTPELERCVDKEASILIRKTSRAEQARWSKELWMDMKIKFDTICLNNMKQKEALCKFQYSHFGMCSYWFAQEVEKSCGDDFGYRKKFCEQVCPPPPPREDNASKTGMLDEDWTPPGEVI
mmetsp:Transcript_83616/g.159559  ORF Transcript_83616/g.159559 Transcript_83616/m.159559 type:complete len:232 (-) Transcript_83616:51-746(-)